MWEAEGLENTNLGPRDQNVLPCCRGDIRFREALAINLVRVFTRFNPPGTPFSRFSSRKQRMRSLPFPCKV